MKTNLGYIAVGLYILIMLGFMIMPKKWLKSTAKKDFGVTDAEWNRKDIIGYYRILFMIGGLVTIAIILMIKYV